MPQEKTLTVAVVIPALNEEKALPSVLEALRSLALAPLECGGARAALDRIVVVDNGSTDGTAAAARRGGATVVAEPRRGYGRACLAGLAALASHPPEVVVFLDADASDDPRLLPALLAPIAAGECDLVLGSRSTGELSAGAMPPQARWGNALAVTLIHALYGFRYTDLGPFRAVRHEVLARLNMRDPTYGWTAEMQVKALRAGLRVREIPVPYRKRIGTSKISGTVKGTIKAGSKILWTIARERLSPINRAGGPS